MWLKLCLLLAYIVFLFILSRILELISWYETGNTVALSGQLLTPVALSVAKMKSLLEQRGVSYVGIVEKQELASLVEASGKVTGEESEAGAKEESPTSETQFISGAHFIEKVEDAKDSVWLVQIITNSDTSRIMSGKRWDLLKSKVSRFGVRTGLLDCSLDFRYCIQKGWVTPLLLLALPSQFEKKANVAMYNYTGSVKETAVFHWVRDKLDKKVERIHDPVTFRHHWQEFSGGQFSAEIRVVMFTNLTHAPLFYSALSVKFPGRVKFGLVNLNSLQKKKELWTGVLQPDIISSFPAYVVYTAEEIYKFGMRPGELFTFSSMEKFFKCLYPCLNDIFICSFYIANTLAVFELSMSKCRFLNRILKFILCLFKYNIAVIMLWLPLIGIFQMPLLDRVNLLALKVIRMFSVSYFGTVLRSDYSFYINNPMYLFLSFSGFLALTAFVCQKYRQEEQYDQPWWNLSQLQPYTYIHPPDLFGGLDMFRSHLTQSGLWLPPAISSGYIQDLPVWKYEPRSWPQRASSQGNAADTTEMTYNSSQEAGSFESPPANRVSKVRSRTSSLDEGSCPLRAKSTDSPLADTGTDCSQDTQSELSCSCSYSANPCRNRGSDEDLTHLNSCAKFLSAQHDSQHSALIHPPLRLEPGPDKLSSGPASDSGCAEAITAGTKNSVPPEHSQSSLTSLTDWGSPLGFLESHQCVICLDDYAPLAVLCGLPCGHVFHEFCIVSWLRRDKHFCPICRWPSYKPHPSFLQT